MSGREEIENIKDKKEFGTHPRNQKEKQCSLVMNIQLQVQIVPRQSNDYHQDLQPCVSLGNINIVPKKAKILLETDFPVIEIKPIAPITQTVPRKKTVCVIM